MVLAAPFAVASDRFYDVPYGFAHDEINRIANRYITTGCGTPGAFCPAFCANDLVARNQMAVFLDRLIYASDPQTWGAYASFDTTRVNGTYEPYANKAAGSFFIDHPLDPANKYLAHSFTGVTQ